MINIDCVKQERNFINRIQIYLTLFNSWKVEDIQKNVAMYFEINWRILVYTPKMCLYQSIGFVKCKMTQIIIVNA